MNVSIRGLNDNLFKELKAEAAREGSSIADVLNGIISNWLASRKAKTQKLRFLDLKPCDWGPGTENASAEIDTVLYGGDMPR